jgi:hypothetical protein
MSKSSWFVVASALAAASFAAALGQATAAMASKASTSFPVKFRGDWYGKPGSCNRGLNGLSLRVGATSLNYFDEFNGRLTRIIRQSDRAVHYAAEYSADGHRWEATETLRLSPKRNEMTLTPARTAFRYYRCTREGAK